MYYAILPDIKVMFSTENNDMTVSDIEIKVYFIGYEHFCRVKDSFTDTTSSLTYTDDQATFDMLATVFSLLCSIFLDLMTRFTTYYWHTLLKLIIYMSY